MRKLFALLMIISCVSSYAQKDTSYTITDEKVKKDIMKNLKIDSGKMIRSATEPACRCIDSISLSLAHDKKVEKIKACIDKEVVVYQMMEQINKSLTSSNNKIIINTNPESKDYIDAYREIERWLMDSCSALKIAMRSYDKENPYSSTNNDVAREAYNKGNGLMKQENYNDAIPYFKKATENDENFTFAWDNLGLCYRKTEQYDKALKAYQKSLSIYPDGDMPLHNIPFVYEYMKDYDMAIKSYKNLLKHFDDDPETYFGIGRIYAFFLNDYEQGLDNMCKAYNLYIKQSSPYRADAEKAIGYIYSAMKKNNQEDKFNEILKTNNISTK
jgi:tetratricopeptide (TPR) repeat protein